MGYLMDFDKKKEQLFLNMQVIAFLYWCFVYGANACHTKET